MEEEINTLNDFLESIDKLYGCKKFREDSGNNVYFYRGHVDKSWSLLPSVFRESENDKGRERRILLNYRDHLPRSVHHRNFDFVKDRIEILAEMQHYAIPTRLLDWTMSPLIALYFSVRKQDINNSGLKQDSCVWVFNPWRHQSKLRKENRQNKDIDNWYNMMKLGRVLLSDRQLPQIKRDLQAIFHTSEELSEKEMSEPIGMIAPYQNNRMIHQASAFTIHGTDKRPLEEIDINREYLKKIIIPQKSRQAILKELNRIFINEYTVFPDFVGMSNEIKDKGSLYHFRNNDEET